MNSEQSYLDRLKQGHPDAFEKLAEQFEGRLYRFFFCDHRDHHLAEEQSAETFAQLVRSLPTMRGEMDRLPAFVFSVARHVRARHWRAPRSHDSLREESDQVQDSRPSAYRQLEACEELEKVLVAVSTLETSVRDVFVLRFVEEYSIKDVSAALELPIGTVKSHIHRGRLRLKKLLSNLESPT